MLGAERLVYGRLGETLFTVRIDGTLPPPRPGDRVPLRVAAERLHWFDAGSGKRVALMRRLALPAVDRPPRRRQAGAGEHAGRLSRRREPRLPRLRMRRQAQRRRRAVPAARRHAGAHDHRRTGVAGERRWAELSRLDAGSWHSRAFAGEPLASLQAIAALRACATASRSTSRSSPRPGSEAQTGARGRRRSGAAVARPDAAAAAQLVPARGAARARASSAPELPRALLLDTLRPDCLELALALAAAWR